jgi:hypothetical protein
MTDNLHRFSRCGGGSMSRRGLNVGSGAFALSIVMP